jgi:serine/threonine protein kinase
MDDTRLVRCFERLGDLPRDGQGIVERESGAGGTRGALGADYQRQVAIKVLPVSVAGDPERLARFQREAEVLAALNHPHIAAIYGLE